jgi:integrase
MARLYRIVAISLPDRTTLKGKRDYVILALLVGCALRRNELAQLEVETIQQREGRWVLADLEGKGRRIRTVATDLGETRHQRMDDRGWNRRWSVAAAGLQKREGQSRDIE